MRLLFVAFFLGLALAEPPAAAQPPQSQFMFVQTAEDIPGVALPPARLLPGLALAAEYRLFRAPDSNLCAVGNTPTARTAGSGPGYGILVADGTDGFSGRVGDFEGFSPSLMIGAGYRLGAVVPRPVMEAVASALAQARGGCRGDGRAALLDDRPSPVAAGAAQ